MRVDPLYSLGLSGSVNNLTSQEDTLTQELSSGLAVTSASVNPLAASGGVALGGEISRDDAYVQAASTTESRMNVADSALGSAVTQITSAISLATEGLGGTMDSANVQSVSQQLAGIRDQVLSLANTSYAGSYVFAGTNASVQPFTNDTSTTPATVSYSGDNNSQYIETPGGQQISTNLPGSSVFTASGASVLASLNNLVADFASGTPSSSTQSDLDELEQGLTALSSQRSVLGNSLSVIQSTSTYTSTNQTDLEAAQSTLVSANLAQIASQLSSNQTQQQALMDVIANSGKYNLFTIEGQ